MRGKSAVDPKIKASRHQFSGFLPCVISLNVKMGQTEKGRNPHMGFSPLLFVPLILAGCDLCRTVNPAQCSLFHFSYNTLFSIALPNYSPPFIKKRSWRGRMTDGQLLALSAYRSSLRAVVHGGPHAWVPHQETAHWAISFPLPRFGDKRISPVATGEAGRCPSTPPPFRKMWTKTLCVVPGNRRCTQNSKHGGTSSPAFLPETFR